VTTDAMLDAALRYARRDHAVFPCEPFGKRPLTPHGLLDASSDPTVVKRWWQTWPDANIALPTGRESCLVVLDVDGDEGSESLRVLERTHEPLPQTASVVTPRAGQHFYFRHRGIEIRNSAGLLGRGLDVRADGGYVIAPPSIGRNGRRYEPDERAPLAQLPAWLLTQLSVTREASPRTPASEWVAIARHGLHQGERNQGLTRLTGHLLARDVDAHLVRELVLLVNHRCKPPLTEDEVNRIVESIAGRELRKRNGTRR